MPQSIALLRAALAESSAVDAPEAIIADAQAASIDPLAYCIARFNLDETEVHARAARWCGLAFAPDLPEGQVEDAQATGVNALYAVKGVRDDHDGHDRLYSAPGFEQFLVLHEALKTRPELADRICVVPPRALRRSLADSSAPALIENARHRLATRWPRASGHLELGLRARLAFAALLLLTVGLVAVSPFMLQPVLGPLAAVFIGLPAAFRLFALIAAPREDVFTGVPFLGDSELPVYSVLVPLHDEANMVPQLAEALRALDYPAEKLHVKFIVEAASPKTVAAVGAELSDPRFELFVVPDALPRTKPKALNYVLPLVRGDYVVVFDAEDLPERDQLRRAASVFAAQPGIDCLQAEIVVDNGRENWLTALYAAEYAGQFGLMLPTLARFGLPLPLGGNSNHFRTRALKEVGGWDAHNVTEDADLGVRLSRLRYRTATLWSHTVEESPARVSEWLNQRTRWLKGWMQTFIVHNRRPGSFLNDMGLRNFLAFQVYVGGLILAGPLHTAFLVTLVARLALTGTPGTPEHGWVVLYALILVLGYLGTAALAVAGLLRLRRGRLIPYLLLLPGYWVLTSVASLKALQELLTRPYFWAKTRHRPKKRTEPAPARRAA